VGVDEATLAAAHCARRRRRRPLRHCEQSGSQRYKESRTNHLLSAGAETARALHGAENLILRRIGRLYPLFP
jgi:hypothetical protein